MNFAKVIKAAFEVMKAGHKSLSSHFGKAAGHHTMKAAVHKEHHQTHSDMAAAHKAAAGHHKALHDAFKKADVGEEGAPGSVPTASMVDFHKGMMEHHKAMADHHAAKAAGHIKVHKGHVGMAESCKTMESAHEEAGKAAGDGVELAKADTLPVVEAGELQKALTANSDLQKAFDTLKAEHETTKATLASVQSDVKKIGDGIAASGTAVDPKLAGAPDLNLVLRGPKGEKISVLKSTASPQVDEPAMAGAGV